MRRAWLLSSGLLNSGILYFFHGRSLAILGHALTKGDKVPKTDIERTIRRRNAFEADPQAHTYSTKE
jgi:hypothetical protein